VNKLVRTVARVCGFDGREEKRDFGVVEATRADLEIIKSVFPFTMTSKERIWALINAVGYTLRANLPGDYVECGVWRGGSSMAMALKLLQQGMTNRPIWLYDTFCGMTAPVEWDKEARSGRSAHEIYLKDEVRCVARLDEVKQNLISTGYPSGSLNFVQGDIQVTLTHTIPENIALLRLDTDWYESTKLEMEVLFPRLSSGGVCIVDDYGHWEGARKAVEEYLTSNRLSVLLNRIDDTGRIFVKP
jgi:hypothetical protein